MRGQLFPRVRIFEAWTAIDGPAGCIEHRGYPVAFWWLGFSAEFTFARRVKP
ncbi:hypothetical protein [Sphingomonas sp. S-NIH.Pt1_0416]|uniref:hypothetical protein n=1 Tax=Sphingomonas sp. S-NIH.Pt1_0416 TaxID=1920123 RepID=UPI0013E0184E|nr:hypothetical protein [Sphingomonas sp. S-NIH.Pt1_0416]